MILLAFGIVTILSTFSSQSRAWQLGGQSYDAANSSGFKVSKISTVQFLLDGSEQ
jgi:ribose/xylose/arabinose/galactoside ABC-type transport system permease subunit